MSYDYIEKKYPKFFRQLKKDPDDFAQTLPIDDLHFIINRAKDLYYNGDLNGSSISDYAYDALFYYYNKKVKYNTKTNSQIGAKITTSDKVKLPFFMPSLNKIKLQQLPDILSHIKYLSWSVKLDGVSIMVVYSNKMPINIYLRGNGEYGRDITHIKDYITFPTLHTIDNIVVRGECVIKKKLWRKKYSNESSTARNFVSGILNSKTPCEKLSDIDFVAFDIVMINQDELPCLSDTYNILQQEGFSTVKNGFMKRPLAYDIVSLYEQQYEKYRYFIDGIVFGENIDRTILTKNENPTDVMAFKMNMEEQLRETKVINIEWNITRHGRYFPVVIFKPVFIDGIRLQRATGHNADHVINIWKLQCGTKITVTRSGGVIPQIVSVEESDIDEDITEQFYPDNTYEWEWSGKDIVVIDKDNCPEVQIKKLVHFFTTLGISGIKEGTITNMWNAELQSVDEILDATIKQLKTVRLIGVKKATSLRNNMDEGIANCKLHKLLAASGCFDRGLGKNILRQIVLTLPMEFTKELTDKQEVIFRKKLLKIRGISYKRIETFITGYKRFIEFSFMKHIDTIVENNINHIRELEENGYNRRIEGQTFVLSNVAAREAELLQDYIFEHGGEVKNFVDANITAVIAGNIEKTTTKMLYASQHGINVYTVSEFKQRFKVTIV